MMWGPGIKLNLMSSVAGVALVSALGAGGTAHAQGVNWAGFYAGVYGGGAWSRSKATSSVTCPPMDLSKIPTPGGYFCDLPTHPVTSANAAAVSAAGTGSLRSSNFVGGLQTGYNWQADKIVFGVEVDFGAFGLRASRQASGVYPVATFAGVGGKSFTVGSSISTDWLFTARGRLGWTTSHWLLFVTGGLALTNMETAISFSDTNALGGFAGATGAGSSSSDKLGWTIGAGAEYAVNKNWSVKAEYLYVDFGSITASAQVTHGLSAFAGYSNLLSTSTDLKSHVARVGINYKF